jgi:anti-sigma factor RsiW
MSLSDSDLELLESHLDGELSVVEEEALRDRMNIEPELASVLETLRSERDARRMALVSFEPDDAAVERFNRSASREIQRVDRESFWRSTSRTLRVVAAAAACLVIGFSVGRIADSGVLNRPPGERVANVDPNQRFVEVTLTDESGRELGIQRFASHERAREFIQDCEQLRQQREKLEDVHIVPTSQEEQF